MHNQNTFTVAPSFPKKLGLKNLGDWEEFESCILHETTCRLLRLRGGVLYPELATSWKISTNKLNIEFSLREGAYFADGTQITADDVLFSIKRSLLCGGQYSSRYFGKLLGHEKLKNVIDNIEGLKKLSKYKIAITLTKPAILFVEDLAKLPFSILPRNGVDQTRDTIHSDFAASGVYKIDKFTEDEVILPINDKNWQGKESNLIPYIRIIPASNVPPEVRLMNAEIDTVTLSTAEFDLASLEKKNFKTVVAGPSLTYLRFDFKGPTLSINRALAKDLNFYLNRNEIVESAGGLFAKFAKPSSAIKAGIEAIENESKKIFTDQKQNEAELRLREFGKSELGIESNILPAPLSELTQNPKGGEWDAAIAGHALAPAAPAAALQFLAGTEPQKTNLPSSHSLFSFYSRIPDARTYEQKLELVREYNRLNEEDSFIAPLALRFTYIVFAGRFDISAISGYEGNWRISEIKMPG